MTNKIERITFRPKTLKDIAGKGKEIWTGNVLRRLAEIKAKVAEDEEKYMEMDMTAKFFKELHREIEDKEIIKIQINAKPRMAKSTVGIVLGMWIKEKILEYYPKFTTFPDFSMNNMCRDDQEYTRKMRNPDLMWEVLVVDEDNSSEKTGENITAEKAQREDFSNVQAARYVHTVYICPEGIMDSNADIKLDVRNREDGMCHCYLYYKLPEYGWTLLGYVDIKVKEVIKNWLKVQNRFFRNLKTPSEKDRKYIDYWAKKDFYIEYMVKKHEKMELMNREGILRPRELDYAEIRLEVYLEKRGLVHLMSLASLGNVVKGAIEAKFEEKSMPLTVVGTEGSARRVMSMMAIKKAMIDVEKSIQKNIRDKDKQKIEYDTFKRNDKLLRSNYEELELTEGQEIRRLKKLVEINKKYNKETEWT